MRRLWYLFLLVMMTLGLLAPRVALASSLGEAQTRIGGLDVVVALCTGGIGLQSLGFHWGSERVGYEDASDSTLAAKGGGRVGGTGELAGVRVGHTFSKHGSGNTAQLVKQAQGSGRAVGQWVDDAAAEKFIAERLPELKNGAKSFDLPEGLGRMVNPDGSFSTATKARLVPSGSGVKSAFPEP